MASKLATTFHLFSAITLFFDSVVNLLVHPVSVRSSTITILLAAFGALLVTQQLSQFFPAGRSLRSTLLTSHLMRAIAFLFVAGLNFDRLADLPCDIVLGPDQAAGSAGGIPRNVTSNGNFLQQGPRPFGTSIYLTSKLAPRCVKVNDVPGQPVGSSAWVNVGVSKTAWVLVLVSVSCTLLCALLHFLLAVPDRPGKPPQEASSNASMDVHLDRTPKQSTPTVSDCRIDIPSFPPIQPSKSFTTLDPAQGSTSTPDEAILHIDRLDHDPISARAASETYTRHDRYGYGYDYSYGCDRAVDFASGCIMHYPLFSQNKSKKKEEAKFPTLLPVEFSRSPSSGLTPRGRGKSRLRVCSKPNKVQEKGEQEASLAPINNGGGMNGLLSPSGIDPPSQLSIQQGSHPGPSNVPQRRLNTAESGRSILTTTTLPSRPGTANSARSGSSFRLMRRRHGLFAALNLHLDSRLSGVSQDVASRRYSFESGRSCSAGTFGGESPLPTPRAEMGVLPGVQAQTESK